MKFLELPVNLSIQLIWDKFDGFQKKKIKKYWKGRMLRFLQSHDIEEKKSCVFIILGLKMHSLPKTGPKVKISNNARNW